MNEPRVADTLSRPAAGAEPPFSAPGGRSRPWVDWPRGPVVIVSIIFAVGLASYLSLPLFWQDFSYQLLGMLAVVSVVAGVRRWRPPRPTGWYLLAGGLAMFSAADAMWFFYDFVLHKEIPDPSAVDIVYLAAYPLLTWGLVTLARAGHPGRSWGLLLEGGIFGMATFAVGWAFLVEPALEDATGLAGWVHVAYPVADVVLLGVLAGTAFGAITRGRTWSYALLVAGVVSQLVGDIVFAFIEPADGYQTGHWVDLTWLLSYGLLAIAALDPSMQRLTGAGQQALRRFGPARLVAVGLAAIAGPTALMLRHAPGAGTSSTPIPPPTGISIRPRMRISSASSTPTTGRASPNSWPAPAPGPTASGVTSSAYETAKGRGAMSSPSGGTCSTIPPSTGSSSTSAMSPSASASSRRRWTRPGRSPG